MKLAQSLIRLWLPQPYMGLSVILMIINGIVSRYMAPGLAKNPVTRKINGPGGFFPEIPEQGQQEKREDE